MSSDGLGAIRALICEDEPLGVRALREYLRETEWIEIVGEARDGREAMRLIHKLEPDLVFMDIQMPGLSGVEVMEAVTHRPAVVFTTAFDEYAIAAFEIGAVDYLVKPFGKDRLHETLERVRVRLVGEGRGRGSAVDPDAPLTRIFARRGTSLVPVRIEDVLEIRADAGSSDVVTASGTFRLSETLAELESRLDPNHFVRVHRSHLVHLDAVRTISRYDDRRLLLVLTDGTEIVTSRRGAGALRERMG